MLSVIVPIYNKQDYIHKCVESILMQKYKDIELVLIDDGSTDMSGHICDELQKEDNRVKIIHKESNEGSIKARISGIENAEGEYLTFVDADDWIEETLFIKQMQIIRKGYDMVACMPIRFFSQDHQIYENNEKGYGAFQEEIIMNWLHTDMIWDIHNNRFGLEPSLWGKVAKRDVWYKHVKNASRLDIWYGEDVAVIYTMMKDIKSLYIMNENLYYHRQREVTEEKPYLTDKAYLEKLYCLYEYLSSCFENNLTIQKQIEYFYMYSVNLRQQVHKVVPKISSYLFPFGKVPKDSKVILYGAGKVGQQFYSQIEETGFCEIILWVDKNYEKINAFKVVGVDAIQDGCFDFLVIANASEIISKQIRAELVSKGINDKCIIG